MFGHSAQARAICELYECGLADLYDVEDLDFGQNRLKRASSERGEGLPYKLTARLENELASPLLLGAWRPWRVGQNRMGKEIRPTNDQGSRTQTKESRRLCWNTDDDAQKIINLPYYEGKKEKCQVFKITRDMLKAKCACARGVQRVL